MPEQSFASLSWGNARQESTGKDELADVGPYLVHARRAADPGVRWHRREHVSAAAR